MWCIWMAWDVCPCAGSFGESELHGVSMLGALWVRIPMFFSISVIFLCLWAFAWRPCALSGGLGMFVPALELHCAFSLCNMCDSFQESDFHCVFNLRSICDRPGGQLGVRFPWCFHGSGICGSFGESEWHGVSMLGALGGQVWVRIPMFFSLVGYFSVSEHLLGGHVVYLDGLGCLSLCWQLWWIRIAWCFHAWCIRWTGVSQNSNVFPLVWYFSVSEHLLGGHGLYLEDLGCLSLCLNYMGFSACATCVTALWSQVSIVFSTCAAFVTGLVDSLGSDSHYPFQSWGQNLMLLCMLLMHLQQLISVYWRDVTPMRKSILWLKWGFILSFSLCVAFLLAGPEAEILQPFFALALFAIFWLPLSLLAMLVVVCIPQDLVHVDSFFLSCWCLVPMKLFTWSNPAIE